MKEWWGATMVIDARVGGVWVGGWGEGENLGHQTVLQCEITRLETDRVFAVKVGDGEVSFEIVRHGEGAEVTVSQSGYEGVSDEQAEAALQSWVGAVNSLKAWAEEHHPYEPPAQTDPEPSPVAEEAPGSDPYGAAAAVAGGEAKVLDDAGFGVTDPNAVVKSWSKEQGFGYVTHAKLGDIVFDYDGCDFEPAAGDKVLLLVLGKRYDGQPKVKRISCPSKGSSIK
jgi:hypothetical protein